MPKISLLVEGKKYEDWTEVQVQRSMDSLCGTFEFISVDRLVGKDFRLKPLLTCIVLVDEIMVMNGIIDSVDITITADSHAVAVRGRDKTCDLIDCSVDWPPPKLRNVNLFSLAKILCEPFGIKVKTEVLAEAINEKFQSYAINKGESVFEALDRASRARGVMLITNEKGELVITRASKNKSEDVLRYGDSTLKEIKMSLDFTNRFSKYYIYGQRPGGNEIVQDIWGGSVDIFATYPDTEVTRNRTILISSENATTKSSAKKRAQFEKAHRAGESQKVSVTVVGWKQSSGKLWKPNFLVSCFIPPAYLSGELIIAECHWSYSEGGATTSMELRRPDTFDIELTPIKAKTSKANPMAEIYADGREENELD